MWTLTANKRGLLDIFGVGNTAWVRDLSETSPTAALDGWGDELLLIWSNKPNIGEELAVPEAIAVKSDDVREFLSWATTFIGGYRPFTAFVKVVSREQLRVVLGFSIPDLGKFADPIAGMIIGETMGLLAAHRPVSSLSALQCQSTYLYSLSRAFALGYLHERCDSTSISAPWALARRLTRQPIRKINDDLLHSPINVLMALVGSSSRLSSQEAPGFILESCKELRAKGEVTDSWRLLEGRVATVRQLATDMRGPRENRVRVFERVLREPNELDPTTRSFLIGLLADQIAPGTFEHVDLVAPYSVQHPIAFVWYGLCAGLHPESEVQQVSGCLGRRLVRDLLVPDPIWSRPKYDISVPELEIYLDREATMDFRVASASQMVVELLPGVPAHMRWPTKDVSSTDAVASPRELPGSPLVRQPELQLDAVNRAQIEADVESYERQVALKELIRAVDGVRRVLEKPKLPTLDELSSKGRAKKTRRQ